MTLDMIILRIKNLHKIEKSLAESNYSMRPRWDWSAYKNNNY